MLSDRPSSSSDEEELEVQHWRKEKFLREEYIRSTMVRYHYNTIIVIIYTHHQYSCRNQLN